VTSGYDPPVVTGEKRQFERFGVPTKAVQPDRVVSDALAACIRRSAMPHITNKLSPSPDRGLASQHARLSPVEIRRDRSGAQTVAAAIGAGRWYNETGKILELTRVDLRIVTAPTGADLIVDVNKNGTTVFTAQSQRPKIVAAANAGTSTPNVGTLTVPVLPTLAPGDYVTVDVDQIGSGVAGSDLFVTIQAVPIQGAVADDSVNAVGPVSVPNPVFVGLGSTI